MNTETLLRLSPIFRERLEELSRLTGKTPNEILIEAIHTEPHLATWGFLMSKLTQVLSNESLDNLDNACYTKKVEFNNNQT